MLTYEVHFVHTIKKKYLWGICDLDGFMLKFKKFTLFNTMKIKIKKKHHQTRLIIYVSTKKVRDFPYIINLASREAIHFMIILQISLFKQVHWITKYNIEYCG